MNRLAPLLVPAQLIVAALASGAVARAEDAHRIAVSAKGTASTTADSVELELTVSARADESADAEKKYRHKLKELLASLKEGKAATKPAKKEKPAEGAEKPAKKKPVDEDDEPVEKAPPKKAKEKDAEKDDEGHKADDGAASAIPFEISERGLAFGVKASKEDQNPFKAIARMNGGPAPAGEPPFVFSSKVVATIKGVKKLDAKLVARRVAQLMDLGIDAGADGTDGAAPPVVKFNVDDLESLRREAYEDAMRKAKGRCEKLAQLGGRKLGLVASVREGAVLGGKPEDMQAVQMKAVQTMFGGAAGGDAAGPGGFEVSTEVELSVEFELAK